MNTATLAAMIGLIGFVTPTSVGPNAIEGARALVAQGDAEGLFLQYGAATCPGCSSEERRLLAEELVKGAGLAKGDAFVAHGLLSRANALFESASVLVQLARVEIELNQKGGAIEHLDRAIELDAQNTAALMTRGELAFGDGDFAAAVGFFERAVKLKAKGAREWLEKSRRARDEAQKAQDDFKATERSLQERLETARKAAVRDWLTQIQEEEQREAMAPGGVRQQRTERFTYAYTAGRKTQGEMNLFERRIGRLLDKAYAHVSGMLGHKLKERIPVLLMTTQEYMAKFAGQPVARAGAFWNGRQIVVNGQTEIDARFAAVMAHELTHAFVQDIVGRQAAIPRWANEGLAEYVENSVARQAGEFPRERWVFLKQLKKRGPLPKLNDLDFMFAQMTADVQVAYLLSAYAVHLLIKDRGMRAYVDMLREMRTRRHPARLDQAMQKHLKVNTKWLEGEIAERL
ncbi:MAG: hypothetical protein IKC51_03540 [Myxococcaceae bacterium]|nr:hypothetical protein [Myxococcaceae bacterium]